MGPNAKGEIPEESLAILKEVGRWMKENGESIYGCGISELPKPEWGRYTQKGKKVYAHIFEESVNAVTVDLPPDRIEKARLLRDGAEIWLEKPWNAAAFPSKTFFTFGGQSFPLPDETDTVVELTLK